MAETFLSRGYNTRQPSIERADWPKLHDMFKTSDARTWQRKFPLGFLVKVCALNLLFIKIFTMLLFI